MPAAARFALSKWSALLALFGSPKVAGDRPRRDRDAMPVTPDHSTYRDNRRIGGGAGSSGPPAAGAGWQPRFGGAIILFGEEVTLGPEHLVILVTIGVLGGVEAAIATVLLFLGYLYFKANPLETAAGQGAGPRTARRRVVRQPGIIGTLKYFFGPLPEGPAFAPGEPSDEQAAPSGGRPVEATQPPVQQPPKAPAAPAVETAADRARSAAARDAAAKRAMERAAAAAQQPGE